MGPLCMIYQINDLAHQCTFWLKHVQDLVRPRRTSASRMDRRRKGGGYKQRIAREGDGHTGASDGSGGGVQRVWKRPESAAKAAEQQSSALVQYLIMQWAWGYMSPQEVQQICRHTRDDMRQLTGKMQTIPDIDTVAGFGTEGRYPSKINGQLQSRFCGNMLSKPLETQMPMVTLSKEFRNALDQKIFLPHVLFSDIYNQYPDAWRERILPSTSKLNEFWHEMQNSPILVNHPIRNLDNYQSRAIPLAIHGDGVPIVGVGKTWGKSVDVFSWRSLLATGSTIQFTFYVWSVFQKLLAQMPLFNTKSRFWRIFVWSLENLQRGTWPTHDWNGRPLASPIDIARAGKPLAGAVGSFFVAVVWLVTGDLEHFNKELKLPNSSRNDHPCCFCPGNASVLLNAYEFREGKSGWLSRIYTKIDWATNQFNVHVLFRSPVLGVTVLNIAADWMHNKNLGTDGYFYGSVLFLLVFDVLPGTNNSQFQISAQDCL